MHDGESAEAFVDRRKREGRPIDASAAQIRRWEKHGVDKKKTGKPFKEPAHLMASLRALLVFWLTRVAGSICANSCPGPVALERKLRTRFRGSTPCHSARQIGKRICRIEQVFRDISQEDYEAVCESLQRYPCIFRQRRLIFQIDATELRVRVYRGPNEAPGKVWVTIVLDVATRLIVGWAVHFAPPTRIDTLRALLHAILPTDGIGLVGWGLPYVVQSDNGSIFGGLFLKVLRNLSIFSKKTPPGKPSKNGRIERVNRTLKRLMEFPFEKSVEDLLPASLYRTCQDADGVFTEEEILAAITAAVVAYNTTKHRALGMSPARKWQSKWPNEIRRPYNEKSIFAAFTLKEPARVKGSNVITLLDGREWRSDAFYPYRSSELTISTALREAEDLVEIRHDEKFVADMTIPRPNPVYFTAAADDERPNAPGVGSTEEQSPSSDVSTNAPEPPGKSAGEKRPNRSQKSNKGRPDEDEQELSDPKPLVLW